MTLLYPSVQKLWSMDCIQRGDYLASKRTSNKTYSNQYAGTVVVDQVQRYGASEGLVANAALRWDELLSDWSSGTLSNTVALQRNRREPGDGDLELSLAGVDVVAPPEQTGFSSLSGIMLTGYASSGYASAYVYRQIWSGSQVVASNDTMQFDIWIASTSPSITASVNFTCSDGSTLQGLASGGDQQGLSLAIKTDLSGLANDQWFSRTAFSGYRIYRKNNHKY